MAEPRRTFGPVVLLGLAAGALAAVAGARPWVADTSGRTQAADPLGLVADAGEMPLAAALGLVVLACWGVLLVTRARVRRVVAVLGLLAAVGLAITVVVGWVTLPDQVRDALTAQALAEGRPQVRRTGWLWAAAAGSLGSVVATFLAVRWAPRWPEMGSRYDAPGAGPRPGEEEPSDLWKAMDEGRDPTV